MKVIPWIMSRQKGYGSYQSTMRQQNILKKMQATKGQCERLLKRDLRGEEDEEQQHLMEVELELLAEERSQMILEDKKAKGNLRERRRIFEEEAEKSENSKVEGHTVRGGMEGVTKDNGIEFGAFRVGDIQGNGCRNLMSCGGEITKYMADFLPTSIPLNISRPKCTKFDSVIFHSTLHSRY